MRARKQRRNGHEHIAEVLEPWANARERKIDGRAHNRDRLVADAGRAGREGVGLIERARADIDRVVAGQIRGLVAGLVLFLVVEPAFVGRPIQKAVLLVDLFGHGALDGVALKGEAAIARAAELAGDAQGGARVLGAVVVLGFGLCARHRLRVAVGAGFGGGGCRGAGRARASGFAGAGAAAAAGRLMAGRRASGRAGTAGGSVGSLVFLGRRFGGSGLGKACTHPGR